MTDMRNNKSQMAETETNNTKTLKEIFSEEIRAELASGRTKKPTFEEFKEMVEKEKSKRRKKYTAIAACFVTALVVGFFAFDYMACDVGADKNPKEIIQTEDGVIIEDGGYGSSTDEDNVLRITNWSDIDDIKVAVPEIPLVKYIPNGYKFSALSVEIHPNGDVLCKYSFLNKNNEMLEMESIVMSGEVSLDITDVVATRECKKGLIYFQNGSNKIATIQVDGGVINLIGNISENEAIKIINGIY